MKSIAFWFNRMMTESDINSRFIFLAHGLTSTFALLILTVAFLFAKDKTGYDSMALVAGGNAAGAGLGRWMSKKGGDDAPPKEG